MSQQSMLASLLLKEARAKAARLGVKLPAHIRAFKVGRSLYAVQADFPHNFDHYVSASSVSEAKAEWISQLIDANPEGENKVNTINSSRVNLDAINQAKKALSWQQRHIFDSALIGALSTMVDEADWNRAIESASITTAANCSEALQRERIGNTPTCEDCGAPQDYCECEEAG